MTVKEKKGFHPSILRTYDVRGVVGETLFNEDFYWLGYILGRQWRGSLSSRTPLVALGYDGRLTSKEFASHLTQGLLLAGVKVLDVGCGPTPLVSFAHYHLKTDGCLMVTGSHNPPSFNGLKITFNYKPFYGEDIQKLQEARLALEGSQLKSEEEGSYEALDVHQAYEETLLKDIVFSKPLKVVWDPGNGAMGGAVLNLTRTLTDLGAMTSIVLNAEIDGTFPAHHPDPTVPENLEELIDVVKSSQADVGVAFDGDGDRLGVVDGTGRIIWGDQLMILLAKDVLAKNPGAPIIADVKCSGLLFEKIREMGGQPIMEKTGHSHIKASLAFHKAPLAGELSGHVFFKDRYYGYDDALYAAVRLLEILSQSSQSLANIIDEMPKTFSSPEVRWECALGQKEALIETVKNNLDQALVPYCDIDGVRVLRDYGWWGIRASNTEEAVTLRMEAYTQEDFERIKKDMHWFLPLEWQQQSL